MGTEIKKGIYWVGAVDWDLKEFHSFSVDGTTYNAYLILDEKNVLIDTVKTSHYGKMMEHIREIIDPTKIDYIVSNHSEPDHSGSIYRFHKETGARIIASEVGADNLRALYGDANIRVVRDGEKMKIGKRTLSFHMIPMLHWPDSMVCHTSGVLFSSDAFGQHLPTKERFDSQVKLDKALHEAEEYFANILMPYSSLINPALAKLGKLKLEVIAPSHGIMWKKHVVDIVKKYAEMGRGDTEERAVIVYDTMWGATEKMADAIARGMKKSLPVETFDLGIDSHSEIMRRVLGAKAVIVGSPTQNNLPLPPVMEFLYYTMGLRPKNKVGAAFGSYGWGGGAVKIVDEHLKKAGVNSLGTIQMKFTPDRKKCEEFGTELGKKIIGGKK